MARERGIELIRGHGRLDGERRVRVGDDVYEARRAVVIAVGSAAALPPVPGLAEARPWTNREATTGGADPERLIVLGGGVVGVEMADAHNVARRARHADRAGRRACSGARSRSRPRSCGRH